MVEKNLLERLISAVALLCTTVVVACGPVVAVEDANDAAAGAHAVGMTTSGPSAPDGDPLPMGCAPGEQTACACPTMGNGTAQCDAEGAFGPCLCGSAETNGAEVSTGGFESEGTSWDGSGSSTAASSTSGGPVTCLPLEEPCPDDIFVETNAQVEAIAACSRIEGSLFISAGVTDLSPLSCLRELGNQLYLESVNVPSLSALSNLQRIEGELEVLYTGMTALDLESLEYVEYFSLYQNNQMETLGVPNLATVADTLDVHDNPMLSTCEIETLVEEALSPMGTAFYDGNADDGCASFP